MESLASAKQEKREAGKAILGSSQVTDLTDPADLVDLVDLVDLADLP